MFEIFIQGKASDYHDAKAGETSYSGFFTLKYRGFNGDGKIEKTMLVLVTARQVDFAKKQAEKNYTVAVRSKGLRAWVDGQGDVRLAMETVELIIP